MKDNRIFDIHYCQFCKGSCKMFIEETETLKTYHYICGNSEKFPKEDKRMKDKIELQKQYIEVKEKLDRLERAYWNGGIPLEKDEDLIKQIKDTFILLKSLNKQIYYEG